MILLIDVLETLETHTNIYLYMSFDLCNNTPSEKTVKGFEKIAGGLAPDVIGMPILFLDHTWRDDDLRGIYADMRKISERYAREVRWSSE